MFVVIRVTHETGFEASPKNLIKLIYNIKQIKDLQSIFDTIGLSSRLIR